MKITFDPAKDAINREKHKVSLAEASKLDWNNAIVWKDTRKNYGEARWIALTPMGERLYYVVFVDRTLEDRRIISLRKANKREFKHYASALDSTNR